jgi:hypothetical protein
MLTADGFAVESQLGIMQGIMQGIVQRSYCREETSLCRRVYK